MIDRLVDILLLRSARERWLLGGMILIALPILVYSLVVMPLTERHAFAMRDLQEAEVLHQWVVARQGEAMALRAAMGGDASEAEGAIGASGVEQALDQAGLHEAISELTARGDGALALRFDQVEFVALVNWLGQIVPVWGYDLTGFRIEPAGDPGMVFAEFALSPDA